MPRHAWQGGPRSDAEPADALPTIRPGRDRGPASCLHCGSSWLLYEQPVGPHARGMLSCQTCSRQVAWIASPLRAAARSAPSANWERPQAEIGRGPVGTPTCGRACRQERVVVVGGANGNQGAQWRWYHDPAAHERVLESQLAAIHEQLERLVTICLTAVLPRVREPVQVVRTGSLAVELTSRRALVSGSLRRLTRTEWLLLACLASRLDAVVAHPELDAAIMPEARLGPARGWDQLALHRLRVHIQRLRRRLGPAGYLIENIIGVGYRLKAEEERP